MLNPALCPENSIFVAAVVLLSPFKQPTAHGVRGIVGNIAWLESTYSSRPKEPRICSRLNQYTAVLHASYDFKRENNFEGTSLNLTFRDCRFPLETGLSRKID